MREVPGPNGLNIVTNSIAFMGRPAWQCRRLGIENYRAANLPCLRLRHLAVILQGEMTARCQEVCIVSGGCGEQQALALIK